MSTQTTSQITAAAIAAQSELYRRISLRLTRTFTKQDGEFDPTAILDTRPYTEEEAEAEADEWTAGFQRILCERNFQGLEDAYLLLGCDLIYELARLHPEAR